VAANTKPAGTVIPPPLGKHSRTTCPTSGWVTHGDGHKTRCPQCDPPWEAAPPPTDPVPPIKSYEDAVKAFDDMTDCPSGQCSPSSRAVRSEQYEQPARRGIFGRLRGR
jgi:hypothetical protein